MVFLVLLSDAIFTFLLQEWIGCQNDLIALEIALANHECRHMFLRCVAMKCINDFPLQWRYTLQYSKYDCLKWNTFVDWFKQRNIYPRTLKVDTCISARFSFRCCSNIFSNLHSLCIKSNKAILLQSEYPTVNIADILHNCTSLRTLIIATAHLYLEFDSNKWCNTTPCSLQSLTLDNIIFPPKRMKSSLLFQWLVDHIAKSLRILHFTDCMNITIKNMYDCLHYLPYLEIFQCGHKSVLNDADVGLLEDLMDGHAGSPNSTPLLTISKIIPMTRRISSLHTCDIDFAFWLTAGNVFVYKYFIQLLLSFTNDHIQHITLHNMNLRLHSSLAGNQRIIEDMLYQCITERWKSLQSLTLVNCTWTEAFYRKVFPLPLIGVNSIVTATEHASSSPPMSPPSRLPETLIRLTIQSCDGFTDAILLHIGECLLLLQELHLINCPQISTEGLTRFAQRHQLRNVHTFSLVSNKILQEHDNDDDSDDEFDEFEEFHPAQQQQHARRRVHRRHNNTANTLTRQQIPIPNNL